MMIESVLPYVDKYGLLMPTKVQSGNGICYTAELVVELNRQGRLTPNLKKLFSQAVLKCFKDGIMRRHPEAFMNDQERIDDYTGALVIAKLCEEPLITKLIWDFGQKYRMYGILPFYYPNELMEREQITIEEALKRHFFPKAWIGIYPAWVASLKKTAGLELSLLEETVISWAGSMTVNWKSHDSVRVAYLTLQFSDHAWAKERFDRKLKEHWISWGALYLDYFKGPNVFTTFV